VITRATLELTNDHLIKSKGSAFKKLEDSLPADGNKYLEIWSGDRFRRKLWWTTI